MLELVHCWWDHKTLWLLWKTVWRLPTKWNILSSCDPAVVPPRALKEEEAYIHIKRSTRLFRAAFFLTARAWKQPRYPSIGEWIQKQRYSEIRGVHQRYKAISSQAKTTWRGFKHVLVSKRSQSEKVIFYLVPTVEHSGKRKLWREWGQWVPGRSVCSRTENCWGQQDFLAWCCNSRDMALDLPPAVDKRNAPLQGWTHPLESNGLLVYARVL